MLGVSTPSLRLKGWQISFVDGDHESGRMGIAVD
jgi:hypothetical protein